MNKDDIIDSVGRIDDDMIQSADAMRKRRPRRRRWGALAACLCAVAVVVSILPSGLLKPNGGADHQGDDGLVPSIKLIYYSGALYECCDIPDGLKRAGLPQEITPDMAGERIAYLENGGPVEYQETARETDKALYQYAPAPTRAVYVLRDGENYMAALFVRTYFPDDPDAYCDLAEVYRFFGIESSADIASIAQTDWNRGKVTGAEVKDPAAIGRFYELTSDVYEFSGMDNDSFQEIKFGGIPEEEQAAAHAAFADESQTLRIKTKDGFCFYMSVYPESGFIYSGHAMAYFEITPELAEWFDENFR